MTLDDMKTLLPPGYTVATGRGTERFFAQVLPPRGCSFFATATTESEALAKVMRQIRDART